MTALRRPTPIQRRLLLAMFAWAMLARALVPAGWMVAGGADGARLVLCDGVARAVAVMPGAHHGHHMPADGKVAPEHPCAFAGPVAAIDAPVLPVPVPPTPPAVARALFHSVVGVGRGLAAPPPPATGPPRFA